MDPEHENYTSNNDFPAFCFRESKWPSTSAGSTVTIVSHAKTKMSGWKAKETS